MTKKVPKAVYHFLPVYSRHVFFGNSSSAIKDEILTYYKESEVDVDFLNGSDDGHLGYVSPVFCKKDEERVHCFVMMTTDDASIGTVTHEATHLVNQIFSYLGQEVDQINDEVQAYLSGYLVDAFMEEVRGAKPTVEVKKKLKRKK